MSFNFGQDCRKHQIDQAFARRVDKKLFPLLERAIKIHSFNFFISQKYAYSQNMLENFKVFNNFTNKIKENLTLDRKEFAFLFLLNYLVLVESLYTLMVDIIAFALINTGKALRDRRTGRDVILFDDLEELALGTKLDFLRKRDAGFKIVANRCDISLRNAAAHLDFTLDAKGNIIYRGGKVTVFKDMNQIWDDIREATLSSYIALKHFYYEKYGKYMP